MSLLLSWASEVGIWAPTQTNGIGAVWIRQILQLNLGSVIMVWLVHNWSGSIRSEQPLYNSLWYVQTDIWKCQLWQRDVKIWWVSFNQAWLSNIGNLFQVNVQSLYSQSSVNGNGLEYTIILVDTERSSPEPEVSIKRVWRTFCHLVKDYTLGMGCLLPTWPNRLEEWGKKDTWSELWRKPLKGLSNSEVRWKARVHFLGLDQWVWRKARNYIVC